MIENVEKGGGTIILDYFSNLHYYGTINDIVLHYKL